MNMRSKNRRAEDYAILSMGALGDTILHYFRQGSIFGQIPSFKAKHPQSKIQIICCSSNKHTHELFQYNPHIYKVNHVPWALQGNGILERNAEFKRLLKGWKCLNVNDKLPGATFSPPDVFVNKEEETIVRSIQSKGKYILIHPFSSYISKIHEKRYIDVIDTMIDKLDYNVVVVGGTYNKSFQQQESTHEETFKYERDGLYNLVNKASVRTAVKLAKGTYGYFGSWSAFYCACWDCPAHPMVLCTQDGEATIDLVNKKRFGNNKYKKIITPAVWYIIPGLSAENHKNIEVALDLDSARIRQEIIQHLGPNKQ